MPLLSATQPAVSLTIACAEGRNCFCFSLLSSCRVSALRGTPRPRTDAGEGVQMMFRKKNNVYSLYASFAMGETGVSLRRIGYSQKHTDRIRIEKKRTERNLLFWSPKMEICGAAAMDALMSYTRWAVPCSSGTTITHHAVLHGWITKTLKGQFHITGLVRRNQKTRVPVRPSRSIGFLLLLPKPVINTVCLFSILHHVHCHDIHYIHCGLKDAFRVKWHKLWLSAVSHWRFLSLHRFREQ